jgi:hypothetical protein
MRRSDAKPRMLSPVLSFEGGMEGTSRTHEARANGRHDNPILRRLHAQAFRKAHEREFPGAIR